MLNWTEGRLGMRHAEYAEAMRRAADGAEHDGAFERAAWVRMRSSAPMPTATLRACTG